MEAWVPDLFYRFPAHPQGNALATRQCLVVLLAIGLFTILLIMPASANDVRPGYLEHGIHPAAPFFTRGLLNGTRFPVQEQVHESVTSSGQAAASSLATEAPRTRFSSLLYSFIPNDGQVDDPDVLFLVKSSGSTLYFTQNEVALVATAGDKENKTTEVIRQSFTDANRNPVIEGINPLPGMANFLIGNDSSRWHQNLSTYGSVVYRNLYSGIDLRYFGTEGRLKREFVVSPGADPSAITLHYDGVTSIFIDENGSLHLVTPNGEMVESPPVCWQEIHSEHVPVEARYRVLTYNTVMISIGLYDRAYSLIIDPVLMYSTYYGGTGDEEGLGIAVDSSGNAYVTGYTASTNFPVTAGAVNTSWNGGTFDAFVVKLNSGGSAAVYSTFYGGSSNDYGCSIAVDGSGNAYVTGYTESTNFPVTAGAVNTSWHGGANDVFVVKLNSGGSAPVYSTYYGGNADDVGTGIAVNSSGSAYVTGYTISGNFPTTAGAVNTSQIGSWDAFVVKLNDSGSTAIYSTYYGGTGGDRAGGIAIDSSGNAYITGYTSSTNFLTTAGAYQTTHGADGGKNDVFIVKLNPAGSGYSDVVYSTYIGGNYEDYGSGIAIDSSGNAYVTGNTHSTDFPTTAGSVKTTNCDGAGGAADAFVVKLNASGSTAVFSTYLCGSGAGGSGNDYGTGIAADSSGNAYVIGYTNSGNFPITSDAVNTSIVGSYDTFVTKLNSGGSTVVYSTYYGGTSYDYANNIFLDSNGYVYITGRTLSTNLLTTAGAVNTSNNGVWDVFVFRLSTLSAPTVTAMAPGSGFNSGSVHIHNITGTNFQSTGTTTINLTKSGETNITATGVTWVSSTQLRSDFNILGKNPGSWGVTVTNPDGQSGTLSGGYTIGTVQNQVTLQNYTTIQDAVNGSAGGDPSLVILVNGGHIYYENVTVPSGKSLLTIRGNDIGSGYPVIDAMRWGSGMNLSATGITLHRLTVINSTYLPYAGIWIGTNSNKFYNVTSRDNRGPGFYVVSANSNTIESGYASNNTACGYYLYNADSTKIYNSTADQNHSNGITIEIGDSNEIVNVTSSSNDNYGINLISAINGIIKNTTISASGIYGINLSASTGNSISNNWFNNTVNTYFADNLSSNNWNITKLAGTNIIGGGYLGGNFWAEPAGTGFSQLHPDTDGDGFSDSAYTLAANNIDYLPLTTNTTGSNLPVADFTGTPTFGNAPLTVQFNDTSTGFSLTSWNWSFGDTTWFNTTNSLQSNATHTYNAPGSYTVSLTVTNATGNNTKSRPGFIVATNPSGGGGGGSDTSGGGPGGGGPGGGPGGPGAGGQQQGQGQQQGPGQGQQQGQQQQQGPGQGQQQVLAASQEKTETISVNTEGLSVAATAAGRQALTIDVPAAEKAGSAVSVRGETIVISQPGLDIIVQAQGIGFGPAGTITGTIQSVGIATAPVTADISIGQVSTSIDASVSSIPTGASVTTTISEKVSSDTQNAFQAAAAQNNLQVQAVAYTMTIEKTNLDATGPATITMTSPAAWVNQHGGPTAIQIGRIGDDRVTEMLATSYAGMDAKGNLVFEGLSRHGLSIFGMISAKASQIKQEQQGVNVSATPQGTPVTPLTVIVGMATWAAGMVTGNIFFMGIGATMLCVVSFIVWRRRSKYDWFFRK